MNITSFTVVTSGDLDVAITIHLHNIFAHTSIDYDTQAARENFAHLENLIPRSQCSSYFEVGMLVWCFTVVPAYYEHGCNDVLLIILSKVGLCFHLCLFCLFVSRIAQKQTAGLLYNFVGCEEMTVGRNH